MASKYRYVLNFTDIDGLRKHKSFYGKTKKIARDKANAFLRNLDTDPGNKSKAVTFATWAEDWFSLYPEQNNLTDASLKGYDLAIKHLNAYFGKMPIQTIKPTHVRKFFAKFKKPDGTPYSTSMLKKVRNTFSAIMEAACDNGIISHNPVRSYRVTGGKASTPKRAYSLSEAVIFSEYAKHHPDGLGPYILLHTGLRLSEMMGIEPQNDFDFFGGTLTLHQTVTDATGYPQLVQRGKTATALRTILLDPDARDYLPGRLECRQEGFLFRPKATNSRRAYMGPRTWKQNAWRRFIADFAADHPEVPTILPGELRHTWFTLMREVNPDLRVVDLQGGHTLRGLTDGNYSHYTVDWLKANTNFPDYTGAKSNKKVTRNVAE